MRKPSNLKKGMKPTPLGELLLERGIGQSELATAIGCTQACINRLVWGMGIPKGETLIKLHNYLGVSTDFLLGLGDENGQRKKTLTAEEERSSC